MQKLWRATLLLFRQYPILWLPLLAADLAAFELKQLQRHLVNLFMTWLFQSHSVLSSAPVYGNPAPAAILRAELLTVPMAWAFYLLSASLYTAALLATRGLLGDIAATGQAHISVAFSSVAKSATRILIFSLKLLGLCLCGFLSFALITAAVTKFATTEILINPVFVYGNVLTLSFVIAYLLAPSAINLLRPADAAEPQPDALQSGRIAAFITVTASAALSYFISKAGSAFLRASQRNTGFGVSIVGALESVFTASPYILLYIALYLIATPNSSLANPHSTEVEKSSLSTEDPDPMV